MESSPFLDDFIRLTILHHKIDDGLVQLSLGYDVLRHKGFLRLQIMQVCHRDLPGLFFFTTPVLFPDICEFADVLMVESFYVFLQIADAVV